MSFWRKEKDEPKPAHVAWTGAESLRPLLVALDTIRLDERNARKHPERNLEAIRISLQTFGQRKPIVIRNGVVIAGNGTVTIARSLGWDQIAAVDSSDMTAEQAKAYAIADNKTGELGEWDYKAMSARFAELPAELLDATGFAAFEREPIMQAVYPSDEPEPKGEPATTFRVTHEQYRIISQATERKAKEANIEGKAHDGPALALICRDYLEEEQ